MKFLPRSDFGRDNRATSSRLHSFPGRRRGSFILTLLCAAAAAPAGALDWSVQTAGGPSPSLVFDGPLPRIAYAADGSIKIALFDGAAWLAPESVAPSGLLPSLARNPAGGGLHVAYVDEGDVYYATRNGGAWTSETVTASQQFFDPSGRSPNLAVDAAGKPHIGFGGPLQGGNGDYSYAVKSGGVWTLELVEGPGQPFTAEHSSMALNSAGVPAIVYNSHVNADNYRTRFTTRAGGTWTPADAAETVSEESTAPGNALKYDSGDVARTAYVLDGLLHYATRAADGTWTSETIADAGQPGVFTLSLALHPATDVPYISLGAGNALKVVHKTGGSWIVETIDSNLSFSRTSIAIDPSGTVVGVAYDGKYAFATLSTNLAIVTPANLPAATAGAEYSTRLESVNGEAPLSWTLTTGSLGGLTLDAPTGNLAGTPAAAGTLNFTAQVVDSNNSTATQSFALVVNPAPSVGTGSLATGVAGADYLQPLEAAGGTGPFSWLVTVGTLPDGLALDAASGVIAGTPAGAGTNNFTVQVRDANGANASRAFSLVINATLAITSSSPLPAGTTAVAYSRTILATGGTPPLAWEVDSGALPAGLSLNSGTGVISGTPAGSGTGNFVIRVADAGGRFAEQSFSLAINPQPAITSQTSLPGGNVGSAYNHGLTATGGTPPLSWAIADGALPPGLALNSANGVISGTPTAASTGGGFNVRITDANGATDVRGQFSLPVSSGVNVTNGAVAFVNRCSSCHGTEPTGSVLRGASLQRLQGYAGGTIGHSGGTAPFNSVNLAELAAYISGRDPERYMVSGRLADSGGTGISSASVTPSSSYLTYPFGLETTTAHDGTYVICCLPAGDHIVTPGGGGHSYTPASRLVSVFAGAAPVTGRDFTGSATLPPVISFAGPANGTRFMKPAAIPLSVNTSDPDGMVTRVEYFAGGESIGVSTSAPFSFQWQDPTSGSYAVRAEATDNHGATASSGLLHLTVEAPYNIFTSGHGIYHQNCNACHGSPPGGSSDMGRIVLIAAHRGVLADSAVVQNFPPHQEPVNGVTASNFVHNLTPQQRTELAAYIATNEVLYTISGRVELADSSGGIAGATLYLDGYNPRRVTSSDANGNYTFADVRRGDYSLSVSHPSFEFFPSQQGRLLTVGYGSPIQPMYGTRKGSSVLGAIRDANGEGLAGATLTIAAPGASFTVVTDFDGLFSLPAGPGTYTVTIEPSPLYSVMPPGATLVVEDGGDGIGNFTFVMRVVRVSPNGDDANSGHSWSAAKRSIGAALAAAPPGGEVWAASGIYYERITLSGRALYGGFAGHETVLEERDWRANATALDGNAHVFEVLGLTRGNMVMIEDVVTFDAIHDVEHVYTSRLDGVSVRNGIATSPSHGAGIHVMNDASPVIANCLISGNVAGFGGGGIYCGASSSPVIINNVIHGNSADRGGGIYCDYGSHPALIGNNIIAGNTADSTGGGLASFGTGIMIVNNTIVSNTVTDEGAGGIYWGAGNSTNLNNLVAFNGGGGMRLEESVAGTFDFNCVFGNTGSNYSGLAPGGHDVALDPLFRDFAGGDYHLAFGSPCIDAGDSSTVGEGDVDMDGEPRIQRGLVDIGADEVPPPPVAGGLEAGNFVVAWPAAETGFVLEYSTNLSSQIWLPVLQEGVTTGGQRSVTLPAANPGQFFRLRK